MGERSSATTLASEMVPEELAFLREVLARAQLRGWHLEIGTAAGGTLCEMMGCFAPERRPRFVVVDPMTYFPEQLAIVQKNLQQHGFDPAQVDFRVAKSAAAFARAAQAGETYDFILIDGAHKIRYVTQDLRWTRLLNVGGLVCCHDYQPQFKGVKWPVDRFRRKYPHYRQEALVGSLLALRKTALSPVREINFWDRQWAWWLAPMLQFEMNLRKRWAR